MSADVCVCVACVCVCVCIYVCVCTCVCVCVCVEGVLLEDNVRKCNVENNNIGCLKTSITNFKT